jgi:hypothetical protein
LGNILKSFLASCVPNLQFVSPIADGHSFNFEIDSDSGNIRLFEIILAKSSDQVSFPDTTVSDDDDFGHKIIFLAFFILHHKLVAESNEFRN